MPRTLVIVNPQSGHGTTARRWRKLEGKVRAALGDVDIAHTTGPRDAERLAREAVRAGVERLVVAGGDGTVAEVATGLLRAELGGYAVIGILPMGTGCDFVRTLGIPEDTDAALAVLQNGSARRVDACRVRFVGRDGAPDETWMLNVASLGVSSAVVEVTERTTKLFGGTVAFAIGTVRALLGHRSQRIRLRVDDELFLDEKTVLAAVANGRHFGGGMRIAPDARIDDGLLEVIAVKHTPTWRLLAKLRKLYSGTLLGDPLVVATRGARIEADAPGGCVALERDGDALGQLPATIEVKPAAIAIIGPKA